MPESVTEFFTGTVKDTFEYREKNKVQRNDFIQLLLELKKKGKIEDVDVNHKELEEELGKGDCKNRLTLKKN